MIFEDIYGHVWPNKRTQNRTHFKKTRPVRTERHTTLFLERGGILSHLINCITVNWKNNTAEHQGSAVLFLCIEA